MNRPALAGHPLPTIRDIYPFPRCCGCEFFALQYGGGRRGRPPAPKGETKYSGYIQLLAGEPIIDFVLLPGGSPHGARQHSNRSGKVVASKGHRSIQLL